MSVILELEVFERFLLFPNEIVDDAAAKDAIRNVVRAVGGSPISEPITHQDYDIDEDVYRSFVTVRYVKHPGLDLITSAAKSNKIRLQID